MTSQRDCLFFECAALPTLPVMDRNRPSDTARAISEHLQALPIQNATSLREVRRHWSQQLKSQPATTVLGIANALVAQQGFANRFIACELLAKHPAAHALLTPRRLKTLGRGMNSWGEVDVFACYISGPAWRWGQVSDEEIERWTRSKDRWWRRAALVSTVPLNQKSHGGSGDVRRTLRICRALLTDRDPMVVQAMSWALRALASRKPQDVRRFLETHKHTIAARVMRETMNKITTGRKSGKPSRS
jgi:3-methyladenine DNA glycosylase AlkD